MYMLKQQNIPKVKTITPLVSFLLWDRNWADSPAPKIVFLGISVDCYMIAKKCDSQSLTGFGNRILYYILDWKKQL